MNTAVTTLDGHISIDAAENKTGFSHAWPEVKEGLRMLCNVNKDPFLRASMSAVIAACNRVLAQDCSVLQPGDIVLAIYPTGDSDKKRYELCVTGRYLNLFITQAQKDRWTHNNAGRPGKSAQHENVKPLLEFAPLNIYEVRP